jgi:ribosomal protein L40E
MKCNHCDSKWETNDKISSSLSTCPFCGKSLAKEKEEEPKSYENSKDALAAIMNKHGPDVLLGEKLKAFFGDYAPSVPQNIKKLVNAVYENGAAQVLKKNLNASQADKESAVKVAIRNLTDAFIMQDMAESIIYEFVDALGWQVFAPEPEPPPEVSKWAFPSSKDGAKEAPVVKKILLFCGECGAKNASGAKFCGSCGKKLEAGLEAMKREARAPTGKGVSVPPNFIRIAGGTFQMGSDDGDSYGNEKPVHAVTVNEFEEDTRLRMERASRCPTGKGVPVNPPYKTLDGELNKKLQEIIKEMMKHNLGNL